MSVNDPVVRQRIIRAGICPDSGKVRHRKKSKAEKHLRQLARKDGYSGRAYWCGNCRGWHVGRKS